MIILLLHFLLFPAWEFMSNEWMTLAHVFCFYNFWFTCKRNHTKQKQKISVVFGPDQSKWTTDFPNVNTPLVKNILMMDLFLTNMQLLASQDVNWWTEVLWITRGLLVFISCLNSHADGTHSLQSIHWWANDPMLHFSKSDNKETNSYILDGLRVSTWEYTHKQPKTIFSSS